MILPPREKIHEALSAIADNRITIDEENNCADVYSSDNSKKYLVEWNDNYYSSNDNATFWQGYPGYPIIAILLMQGKLNYDKSIAEYFKGINWKKINTKFKGDYAKAVESVYQELRASDIDTDSIEKEIDKIYEDLKKIDVIIRKSTLKPPR